MVLENSIPSPDTHGCRPGTKAITHTRPCAAGSSGAGCAPTRCFLKLRTARLPPADEGIVGEAQACWLSHGNALSQTNECTIEFRPTACIKCQCSFIVPVCVKLRSSSFKVEHALEAPHAAGSAQRFVTCPENQLPGPEPGPGWQEAGIHAPPSLCNPWQAMSVSRPLHRDHVALLPSCCLACPLVNPGTPAKRRAHLFAAWQ